VALFLPQWIKDPATGDIRGHGTGTVTVPIAHALAARLGVEVQLMGHPTPPAVADSLKAGKSDVAFMGITPARAADIRLSPPLIVVPFTLLVPADSSIASVSDADRAGIRIAVVRNHESTQALSSILKHAELVGAEVPDAAFGLLRSRQADALASHVLALEEYSTRLPGSRMLEDRYGANLLAMAVSGSRVGWLAYINEFVEEAKAAGAVQRAIEHAGVRGIRVAPAARER
jgi:polar amino acid transport system substrate-binding protein